MDRTHLRSVGLVVTLNDLGQIGPASSPALAQSYAATVLAVEPNRLTAVRLHEHGVRVASIRCHRRRQRTGPRSDDGLNIDGASVIGSSRNAACRLVVSLTWTAVNSS